MKWIHLICVAAVVSVIVQAAWAERPDRPVSARPLQATTPTAVANNDFALRLYAQLHTKPGNLFFSPFSLSTALAMTAQGARGQTADQMYATLGFKSGDKIVHAGFTELLNRLGARAKDRGYQLAIANALWGQKNYSFRPEFIRDSQAAYGAGLREVDFIDATELARTTINAWVEQQTNDRIKNLIATGLLTPDTRLVLTNAIYFKGDWASQFKKNVTRDEPFFLKAGHKATVPLMHQRGTFAYTADDSMQALQLPYVKDELAMVILLPRKVDGLADVEKTLTANALARIVGRLRSMENVQVTLPKFKMTSEFGLGDVLQAMGMKLAFSGDADFSGMTTQEQLAISAVVHKAFVDVNEEGTEAAAATAVIMNRMSAIDAPPIFRADHPFLFFIRDLKTSTILFFGRVSDPSK